MQDTERLRRKLEEAEAELSSAARRVWATIRKDADRKVRGEEVAPEPPPGYYDLPPSDHAALDRTLRIVIDLHAAEAAEAGGMAALMRQLKGVVMRARRLEPGLGERVTFGEAFAVLDRRGEKPGFSPELAEMVVEVPAKRPKTKTG
jgi:hypothetical protein